ncbi:MAG: hypothetical protein KGL67_02360 [Patescibacteria group bacterium]|nr:hypothetical protein [Patescibacteria group bacterium]
MKIVNIIPLKKGLLQNDLTYFTTKEIESGSIVAIMLRNKKVLGLVISCLNVSDTRMNIKGMDFNLKKIVEVKEKSIFLKEYIESVLLVSEYFACSKNNAITSLIPAIFREEYDKITSTKARPIANRKKEKSIKAEKLLLQEPFENRISIYKTLIRENFARKKSVFIVLPTENDIKIFEEQLSKGIESFTYAFHGGLSQKKIIEKFKELVNDEHPVLLLGTAPFLSIPRADMGAIVLEHESSNSYKMIARPHIDLRIFVELFASKINAKFILSDTLLRFETIARRELDRLIPMHPLSFRINFDGEIKIENPRPRSETSSSKFKIFSENSIEEIKNSILKKKNVFIFTLRKGLATQTLCRDCGEIVSCDKCLAPLVLYNSTTDKGRFFVCNRCGEEKNTETVCSHCHSWNLVPLGIGTDTVSEELNKIFPKVKILKLDKEAVKTKKEADKIIKEFEENPGTILVGTEMATYYLKNKVDLSIVAAFDSFWSIPNFKMSEKIIQLIISIISNTQGKFIIQTKNDQDPAILAIQSRNLLSFVRTELEDRKNLSYPPFKRFIKIKHIGNKVDTLKAKELLEKTLVDYRPMIFSGFMAQIKSRYITNALIKLENNYWSLPELSSDSGLDKNLLAKLLTLPLSFEVFVDPEDLL